MSQVHPLARTTPRTRTEIKASTASLTELAERYNITVATARKWKGREHAQDRSHRPHKLSTQLNPAQELLAVEFRRTLLLPAPPLRGCRPRHAACIRLHVSVHGHRAPTVPAQAPSNQRYGRALQRPHQRRRQTNKIRLSRRVRRHTRALSADLQPPHPAARSEAQIAHSSAAQMARRQASTLRQFH